MNALYASTISSLPYGPPKTKGIALGKAEAAALLAKRASDIPHMVLTSHANIPAIGVLPGQYRYLPALNYALAGYHL